MHRTLVAMFRASLLNLPAYLLISGGGIAIVLLLGVPLFAPFSLTTALMFGVAYAVTLMLWIASPWYSVWEDKVDSFIDQNL